MNMDKKTCDDLGANDMLFVTGLPSQRMAGVVGDGFMQWAAV